MSRSNYRILGQIGQGQFGKVYCAIHRQTGEIVALKDLEQRRFPTNKFLREISFLVSLRHPNIIAWQGIEHHRSGRYFVMDYCNGGTLRNLMETEGQLSLPHKLKLISDILTGLDHVHTHKIIHRDIKPENILLNITEKGWMAKLSDFGIACLLEEVGIENKIGGYTGSPAYMAPERFYGKYSYTSDIYAVGILLFELLVGKRPFSGFPGDLISAHLNKPIEIPDTIPSSLSSIIEIALRKLPQRRFKSAGEMLKTVQLAAKELFSTGLKTFFFLPAIFPPSHPFKIVNQAYFMLPINYLAVKSQWVYMGMGEQLCCKTYSDTSLNQKTIQQWTVDLQGEIIGINVYSTGCFIWTRSLYSTIPNYTLYHCLKTPRPSPLFSIQAHSLISTIEPNGQWLAIAYSNNDSNTLQVFQIPTLHSFSVPLDHPFPSQLIALDNRHGLAIYISKSTQFQLFNRRANLFDVFSLPFPLKLITLSKASPYHLFAIDARNPTSGVLISLKPLKIRRISLAIEPSLIVAQSWGYILGSSSGQILLLDQEGHPQGYFNFSKPLKAITAINDDKLLIATLSNQYSQVSTISLDITLLKSQQTHTMLTTN